MIAARREIRSMNSPLGISYAKSLKQQVVGAWRLDSNYNEENGVKHFNFGDKPVGIRTIDHTQACAPGAIKSATWSCAVIIA
jgi:hypothetical protein